MIGLTQIGLSRMSKRCFSQYTDAELEVVMRLSRELARSVFEVHRQGYDVSEVMQEARDFAAEAEMMKKELKRRKRGGR